MQPGDVALFRPHNWVGSVIAHDTMARYCHARLVVDTDGSTIEADRGGVKRGHVQEGDVVVTAPLTPVQRAKVPAAAEALLGVPYGWPDILALGLSQYGIRTPWLAARVGREDRLICSQLVVVVWGHVGYTAPFPPDDGKPRLPQNVSPGDIADLAFVLGWPATTVPAASPVEGKAA